MKAVPSKDFSRFFTVSTYFMLVLLIGCQQARKQETPWGTIFDGKSLEGWEQKGGNAVYTVKDGSIIGRTVRNTPNSFLVTKKMYSDFILEVDLKVDPSMNSGIQIRSNSFDHYQNGRVHGYQIEIDPSDRAWSGGIYDEGRRGWLYDLSSNPKARAAFKPNDWNHYRIEAIADTLKTWVNGIATAHLVDGKTHSGFIGLQVHGIKRGTGPYDVAWRNIRIKELK